MTILSRYWGLLNLHAFGYNRFRCDFFPLFPFTTLRFFGFNLLNSVTFTEASSSTSDVRKVVNKRRYLWIRAAIRAANQAWYACVQQTRLIRLSKRTKHHTSNVRTKEMFEVVWSATAVHAKPRDVCKKKKWQHLRAIISTTIMCGKQIIPLRSPRDHSTSTASNKGNYQKILKNTYFLVGEMLQALQKLHKRKSFAPLESILVRKLHSRFRKKTLLSQSLRRWGNR